MYCADSYESLSHSQPLHVRKMAMRRVARYTNMIQEESEPQTLRSQIEMLKSIC